MNDSSGAPNNGRVIQTVEVLNDIQDSFNIPGVSLNPVPDLEEIDFVHVLGGGGFLLPNYSAFQTLNTSIAGGGVVQLEGNEAAGYPNIPIINNWRVYHYLQVFLFPIPLLTTPILVEIFVRDSTHLGPVFAGSFGVTTNISHPMSIIVPPQYHVEMVCGDGGAGSFAGFRGMVSQARPGRQFFLPS